LAVAGLVFAVMSTVRRSPDAWPARLFALGVFFPIVFMLAVSPLKPIFLARYLTICLPSMVLLAGYAIARLRAGLPRRRAVAAMVAAVAITAGAFSTGRLMKANMRPSEAWRDVTEHLLAHREAGDAVVFYTTASRDPYDYYRERVPARRLDVPMPEVVLPDAAELATSHPRPAADRVRGAAAGRRRIWLVLYRPRAENEPAIRAALDPEFACVDEKSFGSKNPMVGIRVAQYVARRAVR
jgi:hypothetical protein